MLLYSNQQVIRLAVQVNGSVLFTRTGVLIGALVAVSTLAIQIIVEYGPAHLRPGIPNTYAMAALGTLVAFSTIFRNNLAWQRYWEGLGQTHYMYSKWEDAFAQFSVFCRLTIEAAGREKADDPGALAKIDRVQSEYTHVLGLFDLMSALAADRIAHGDTENMDARVSKAPWKEHIMTRRELAAAPDLTGATELPEFYEGSFDLSTHTYQTGTVGWKPGFAVSRVPSEHEKDVMRASEKRVAVAMTWVLASITASPRTWSSPRRSYRAYIRNSRMAWPASRTVAKSRTHPFPSPTPSSRSS
jgi:hypothetical protein